MKGLTWQLVTVIVAGIAGLVAMVFFLSTAGWSEGGIAGMVTGIGAVVTGIIVTVRGQQNQQAQTAALDRKVDTVVAQTNGLSELERLDIARKAAEFVVQRMGPQ